MSDVKLQFKPLGDFWPREATDAGDRRASPFVRAQKWERTATGGSTVVQEGGPMPVGRTYTQLRKEAQHLGVEGVVVIQTAIGARNIKGEGLPKADAAAPKFPGVIVSFNAKINGRITPLKFMCDACRRWQDNLRAITLTLERLRLADLYGVTKTGEQYTGWRALPAPMVTPPPMTVEEAAAFIARESDIYSGGEGVDLAADVTSFRQAYRLAAKRLHPDAAGPNASWSILQQAKEVLERHHGVRD